MLVLVGTGGSQRSAGLVPTIGGAEDGQRPGPVPFEFRLFVVLDALQHPQEEVGGLLPA